MAAGQAQIRGVLCAYGAIGLQLFGGGAPGSSTRRAPFTGERAQHFSPGRLGRPVSVLLVRLPLARVLLGALERAGWWAHNGRMGFPSGTVTLLFTDVEDSM